MLYALYFLPCPLTTPWTITKWVISDRGTLLGYDFIKAAIAMSMCVLVPSRKEANIDSHATPERGRIVIHMPALMYRSHNLYSSTPSPSIITLESLTLPSNYSKEELLTAHRTLRRSLERTLDKRHSQCPRSSHSNNSFNGPSEPNLCSQQTNAGLDYTQDNSVNSSNMSIAEE